MSKNLTLLNTAKILLRLHNDNKESWILNLTLGGWGDSSSFYGWSTDHFNQHPKGLCHHTLTITAIKKKNHPLYSPFCACLQTGAAGLALLVWGVWLGAAVSASISQEVLRNPPAGRACGSRLANSRWIPLWSTFREEKMIERLWLGIQHLCATLVRLDLDVHLPCRSVFTIMNMTRKPSRLSVVQLLYNKGAKRQLKSGTIRHIKGFLWLLSGKQRRIHPIDCLQSGAAVSYVFTKELFLTQLRVLCKTNRKLILLPGYSFCEFYLWSFLQRVASVHSWSFWWIRT